HAYTDIQDALTAAGATDIINVAQGTYKPTSGGDRNATFQLKNGVAVYGGYPSGGGTRNTQANVTTLSGDLIGDDIGYTNNGENSYHVVTGSGTDPTAVLDGFTITGSNAASPPNNLGGGMLNDYGSPTVANCTFSGNSANSGGGMMNYHDSSPIVTNCTFTANSAGYSGGGMYNYSGSSPTVTNCTFSGNSAALLMFGSGGGGMYNYLASPVITNCTFSGNSSDRMNGGGIYNDNCNPTITNCAFSGNSAASYGGGIYGSDATINNSVFWGNTAPNDPQIANTGTTTVNYSDIQGGYAGTGNIDADPLFADPDGPDSTPGTEDDNLRLSADSPCIDAGDNMALPADTADLDNDGNTIEPIPFDLDGSTRIVNGTADMGAYEYRIQLLSPDGAEVMIAGTTYDITWRSDGNIANVSLEYSDANGLAWTFIDPNTPDDGQYEWIVPNVTSEMCLVRVSDAGDPDIFDISDNVFAIFQASPPVVLSPDGGEVFIAAGTETITWEAMERLDFVTIELSDANGIDGSWEVIDPNTPNDGQYEWIVPDITSNQCLVRVSYTDAPNILDDSNDMFTIYVCQIDSSSDLNNDCKTNMPDLSIISTGWDDLYDITTVRLTF
ncbi:MAG: right-handed parallel beta-helix repeat-containing protein, partial [Planctomycetes bacterium]|nr:right-handed parallel beta-helix repeat-containing protein [Planctomycetota bacterium]